MGRTRLFHTIVIVGSSLLASCEKGPAPVAKKDAAVKDATAKVPPNPPLIDASPQVPQIMVAPEPARIHAEKVPRIMAVPPPPHIIRRP